jgi:vitamin B12 transporter
MRTWQEAGKEIDLCVIGRERIAGYGTWDLRARKDLAPGWVASLTLGNVLDKEYTTAKRFDNADYISAGRTAFLSVRYEFGL